jgi:hypothetical protein
MAYEGRFHAVGEVDYGRHLLYPRSEWIDRRGDANVTWYLWFLGILAMASYLTYGVAYGILSDDPLFGLIGASLFALMYGGIMIGMERHFHRKEIFTGRFSGLFERAVVFRPPMSGHLLIIPYGEIEGVLVERRLGKRVLRLRVRGFKKAFGVLMFLEVLGPKGVRMLDDIVHGRPQAVGPPKLVLYGKGAA